MHPAAKDAFSELIDFLTKFELKGVIDKKGLQSELKTTFKKYYALLVIEAEISSRRPWSNKDKSADFSLYMKEATSDACQSLLLGVEGLYKPAYLVLRSAIENFLRCIGIAQDQKVASINNVFDLFELIRDTDFIRTDAIAKLRFSNLKGHYSDLCGFVHTSSSHQMALTNLVGVFPRYSPPDAKDFFKKLADVALEICCLSVLLLKSYIQKLHHKHFDIVSDSLPATVRRVLNS